MRQQMCGRQNNAPSFKRKVHFFSIYPEPGNISHGKRNVAKVIKVIDLEIQILS